MEFLAFPEKKKELIETTLMYPQENAYVSKHKHINNAPKAMNVKKHNKWAEIMMKKTIHSQVIFQQSQ